MKVLKKYYKVFIGLVLGIIISSITSYVTAEIVLDSLKVGYTDNSGLGVDNVQAAIDGTCTNIDTRLTDIEDSMFITKEYYTSYTVAANGAADININVGLSGYTPLGIIGLYTWHGSIYPINFGIVVSDGTKAAISMKNTASSEITSNLQIRVLYKKTTS